MFQALSKYKFIDLDYKRRLDVPIVRFLQAASRQSVSAYKMRI